MAINRGMTIFFTDGNKASFDFPEQADPVNITQQVEDMLKGQYILIEADGSVLLYPLYNVKSIQLFPAPGVMPKNAIKGATLSSQ